jgi:hypothetical protein
MTSETNSHEEHTNIKKHFTNIKLHTFELDNGLF